MTIILKSFLSKIVAKLKNECILIFSRSDCRSPFGYVNINQLAFEYYAPFRIFYTNTVARSFRKRSTFKTYTLFASISTIQVYQFLGWKLEEDNETKKLIDKAKQLLEDGKIDQAATLYKRALQQAIDQHEIEDTYSIKQQLGIIAFSQQNFIEAEKLLLDVQNHLSNVESLSESGELKLTYVLLRLAETYENLNNFKKAEEYYQNCADILKHKIDNASKTKNQEIIELWLLFLSSEAHYYLHRGNYEKSEKYFKQAYDLCVQNEGEISERGVTFLQQLGSVCFEKGDLEEAIAYLKKASDLGKHLPSMVRLSDVYVTLGNIYLKQGLNKDAEIMCDQAYKNAIRHKYEAGVKDATACLQELNDVLDR